MKKWSREYDKCQNCGTTNVKHKGNGFCSKCWENLVRNKTSKRKKWQKQYRENNMDRIRKNNDKYGHNSRQKVVDSLGGVCVRCGFSDIRALQIDHIKNKYQLLCANCNWIKRYEDKEKRELGGAPRKY